MEEGIKTDKGFTQAYQERLNIKKTDPSVYSPLALAYLGDGVYELMIRAKVMSQGNMQVNKMHKKSTSLVKAQAQADMIRLLEPELTQEERTVFKRGRNARSATAAKHASIIEYRMATGFEALVGYLFLTEQFDRLAELISRGLEKTGEA
ncbi:MAG: ribonuclease III [Hungatella sp.]|jgi:ribonuclease-3 family protein|nr:ribonuclease III [Hungatella sp.]